MSGFNTYFSMQLKRVSKIFPTQLLVNLLACVSVGILAAFLIRDVMESSGRLKFRIGIVGDMSDPYLDFGFRVLQSVDDARFMLELVNMNEEGARRAFQDGEIYAYMRIPDGLMGSIKSGANDKPITCVEAEGQEGISSILEEEITDIVSNLVTSSQSGIYGMQSLLTEQGRESEIQKYTKQLDLCYLNMILGRRKLCRVEVLGIANGLPLVQYCFCSILLVFLLLSGINNSPLFTHKNSELPRFLASRGVGAAKQVMGEYLAYVCLMVLCVLGIFLVFVPLVAIGNGIFGFVDWEGIGVDMQLVWRFLVGFLPAAALIAAMQFLLYEMVTGIVNSVLLQFICGISMGYMSGFFYPSSFLPDTMQQIGAFLPTDAAFRYMGDCITGKIPWTSAMVVVSYLACFLCLSIFIRKGRIQRG